MIACTCKKQHKHKLFRSGFPLDIPDPCAWLPLGQKFLPIIGAAETHTHILVRMSTIFGADVHDPKGSQKTLYRKVCVDFSAPMHGTHPRKTTVWNHGLQPLTTMVPKIAALAPGYRNEHRSGCRGISGPWF